MLLNELTVTNYKFSDLVDVVEFSKILDSFYSATGIPNGLIAIDGEVISQSGWISACENFHKVSTESKKYCLKSNFELIKNINEETKKLARGNYNFTFEKAGYKELDDLVDTLNFTTKELAKTDKIKKAFRKLLRKAFFILSVSE